MLDKILSLVALTGKPLEEIGDFLSPVRSPVYFVIFATTIALVISARFSTQTVQWLHAFVPLALVLLVFALYGLTRGVVCSRGLHPNHLNVATLVGLGIGALALSFAVTAINPVGTFDGRTRASLTTHTYWYWYAVCWMCIAHVTLVVARFLHEGLAKHGRTRPNVVALSLIGSALLPPTVYVMTSVHPVVSARGVLEFDLVSLLEQRPSRPLASTMVLLQGIWLLFVIAWLVNWFFPGRVRHAQRENDQHGAREAQASSEHIG